MHLGEVVYYSRFHGVELVHDNLPRRESFSKAVLECWQNRGIRVLQWVVSLEGHADSDVSSKGCQLSLSLSHGYQTK